jgi:hypothetical protein
MSMVGCLFLRIQCGLVLALMSMVCGSGLLWHELFSMSLPLLLALMEVLSWSFLLA